MEHDSELAGIQLFTDETEIKKIKRYHEGILPNAFPSIFFSGQHYGKFTGIV